MAVKSMLSRDPNNHVVIGVDSSSLAVSYVVLEDGIMIGCGEIALRKESDVTLKLGKIFSEWNGILDTYKPDHVFIEKSIFVRNPATARLLSYIVGAVMGATASSGYKVLDVEPMAWKAFLGYRNVSSSFQKKAKEALGNTEGKKFCDRLRKSQTWRVIQYNYPNEANDSLASVDNNIADAWGVALWGWDTVGEKIHLEISDSIRLDLEEMGRLGLRM